MTKMRLSLPLLFAMGALACSGLSQLTPTKDRPAWVDRGGGVFPGDHGTAFYGVGAASNISSPSLRRTAADAEGRADIARVFKSRISNLVRVHTESVSGGGDAASAKEESQQSAEQITKAFTSMELTGVQIVDRYFDQSERTLYSLARMDPSAFSDQVSQM